MSRDRLLAAAARLVTDGGFRGRLFAEPAPPPAELGLGAAELALLRRLDPARLGIVAEGYAGKRLEAVESAFPRTLSLLDSWRPGARRRYLEATPFPADDAAERDAFRAFAVRDAPEGWRRRLLADLASVEQAAHALPLPAPAPYRLHDGLRPQPSAAAWVGAATGPLHVFLRGEGGAYPHQPTRLLALRSAGGVRLEALDGAPGWLWDACSGGAALADLRRLFGDGAPDRVEAWLRSGALEPAR